MLPRIEGRIIAAREGERDGSGQKSQVRLKGTGPVKKWRKGKAAESDPSRRRRREWGGRRSPDEASSAAAAAAVRPLFGRARQVGQARAKLGGETEARKSTGAAVHSR